MPRSEVRILEALVASIGIDILLRYTFPERSPARLGRSRAPWSGSADRLYPRMIPRARGFFLHRHAG